MDTLILNIQGKNIDNFIYKLHINDIEILNIQYVNRKEINIEVYNKDYDNIINIKGMYEIEIKKYKGIKKIKNTIIYNKFLIIALIIGIIIFMILTNIIYDIEIIYSGNTIKNILSEELRSYGITKYSFAKSFDELETIKNKILVDRKDTFEWLMIERVGTKYIIRLEPRKLNDVKEEGKIYNIVAKKDAVIRRVEASSGEIIRNTNDFVKKGDVIITSDIKLYDDIKSIKNASGKVYGEAWYKVSIEYPLDYYEEKETGNIKTIYNIKFLSKYIGIKGFKNKKIEDKYIIKSKLLPIGINKQIQKEIEIINYKLNYDEALEYAKKEARKKIESKLKVNEYIIDEKSLKCERKDSKIVVDIFYTVYEDITGYMEIEGLDDIRG